MMRRALAVLVTVIGAWFFVAGAPACGGVSCEDACNAQQNCASFTGQKGDCAKLCADITAAADAAKCSDAFDTVTTCTSDHACDASSKCSKDLTAFASCLTPYCQKHGSDLGCQDVGL